MPDPDPTRLLFGPYTPPPLRRGDRATCLYRDGDVVITSWTDARISWPRCRAVGSQGGGTGLLVNEELVRAVRTESAEALKHWFGVGANTVWNWRRAFGITQWGTEGSRRLLEATTETAAQQKRGKRRPRSQVRRQMKTRKERGYAPPQRWAEDGWKPEELALLGTMPDEELARKIGRSVKAICVMRNSRGIPSARDGRKKANRPL